MKEIKLKFTLASYNDYIKEFIIDDLGEEYNNAEITYFKIIENIGLYELSMLIEYSFYEKEVNGEQLIFKKIYNTINYYCDLIKQ